MRLAEVQHKELEHLPLTSTPEQISNLKKLTDYLLSRNLKARFTMIMFSDCHNISNATKCGTAGCAIGHGPFAGIPKYADESWYAYAERVFSGSDGDLFDWLFSSAWYDYDNTPEGAAKRILHTLEHGVPVNHEFNTEIYK